ncbi:D-arabinose 1-dehydrogenase, Zn-dependent alcohol dehydrogenase family [Geosmithia morbida]|uniref:D-arabinose 1-dehydrogenase, Zn-dependent alcohol dehydrogenase family n=1 Tax=Geosmithia morbida TaxID=1094350 RepID=A0A9P5D3X5_9HYPO|nr:D-arabinose 1-dehydrogenase, Zn-dependent alcohol dehydrogenase family [Geosmithia morbida]KAF4120934.1 D-arabinose 1-dehydrogenase, Zn-dependent alcohol dehydrogenase family [Geosmithia morbida]
MGEFKNIQTRAYVVDKVGDPFVLQDVVLDEVRDDEVLVEMKYTGLCHTDIVVQHGGMPVGSYPAVLGHEGVGIVRHIGSSVTNKDLSRGDTVLLSMHNCYSCRQCNSGRIGACERSTELNFLTARLAKNAKSPISLPDGSPVHGQFFGQSSLSKMAVVAQNCVVKLHGARPEDLAFLPPLACGYLSGAGTVFNVLDPSPEDTVAVLGVGAVGSAAIMAAKQRGAKSIVAVDIVDYKLQLALTLGATHIIDSKAVDDLTTGIREIFPDGINKIIDTTGLPFLLNSAFDALSHGGTLALVGVPPPTADVKFNALSMLTGCKQVIGVIEGWADPQKLVPQLLQLFNEGKFPIDKISKTYPADNLDAALADLKSGRVSSQSESPPDSPFVLNDEKVIKPILSW